MWIFKKEKSYCTICNKELAHRHKPKKEWNIKGPLCGDCHLQKMQEYYEGQMYQKCVFCGVKMKISDLWEPRWQWDMEGLLCKKCFDKKEEDFQHKKDFCAMCDSKLGFIRYNPKEKWHITGQLCRRCWDEKKKEIG